MVKEIDIASYAGDNTPFIVEENIKNVTTSIEEIFSTSFDWAKTDRFLKNPDQCHALVSTNKPLDIKSGDYAIGSSECKKLLCVKIDVSFSFEWFVNY